jgi:phage tail sheath gpL-like
MDGYTATVSQDQVLDAPLGRLYVIDTEGFNIADEVHIIWAVSAISVVSIPGSAASSSLLGGVDGVQATSVFNLINGHPLSLGSTATGWVMLTGTLTVGDQITIKLNGQPFSTSVLASDSSLDTVASRLYNQMVVGTSIITTISGSTLNFSAPVVGAAPNGTPIEVIETAVTLNTTQSSGYALLGGADPDVVTVTIDGAYTYSSPASASVAQDIVATINADSLGPVTALAVGDLLYITKKNFGTTGNLGQVTVLIASSLTSTSNFSGGIDGVSAVGVIILNPALHGLNSKITITIGPDSYQTPSLPSDTSIQNVADRLVSEINIAPGLLVSATSVGGGSIRLTAVFAGAGRNGTPITISATVEYLELKTDTRYNGMTVPSITEVSLQTLTRELVTYKRKDQVLSFYDRSIFRYPYLPQDWSGISHIGPLVSIERVDVKTFGNNMTVSWDPVLQDTVITEAFDSMDYKFFHALWSLYMSRTHLLFRPRDLNYNEYEIEFVEVHAGKQDRFWVHNVSLKYKIHSVTNAMVSLENRYQFMDKKIFPKAPGSPP